MSKFVVFIIFLLFTSEVSKQDDYQYPQDQNNSNILFENDYEYSEDSQYEESNNSLAENNYQNEDISSQIRRSLIDLFTDDDQEEGEQEPVPKENTESTVSPTTADFTVNTDLAWNDTDHTNDGYRPLEHTLLKFLVSIRSKNYEKFFGDNHYCAGVIIHPKIILTAAHCFTTTNESGYVVVGGTPKRLEKTATTKIVTVSRILQHKKYAASRMENDIAVLILDEPIILGDYSAESIEIIEQPLVGGESCIVVGWGKVYYRGPTANDALYATITVWPQDKCKTWLKGSFQKSMMCGAGDKNDNEKHPCQDDAGSPLICNNKIAGIVSYDFGCATTGSPGLYTNLSVYLQWVEREDYYRGDSSRVMTGIFSFLSLLLFAS